MALLEKLKGLMGCIGEVERVDGFIGEVDVRVWLHAECLHACLKPFMLRHACLKHKQQTVSNGVRDPRTESQEAHQTQEIRK